MISSSLDTTYKLLQNRTVIHKAGSQGTQFICIDIYIEAVRSLIMYQSS